MILLLSVGCSPIGLRATGCSSGKPAPKGWRPQLPPSRLAETRGATSRPADDEDLVIRERAVLLDPGLDFHPTLRAGRAVFVGWQRADRMAEGRSGQRVSQDQPGVQGLWLRGSVEQPPLNSGGIERSALAGTPLAKPGCSTGAVRGCAKEPLEVETEVSVSRHQPVDPPASRLLPVGELRHRLAVATATGRSPVSVPASGSDAVEEILCVAEDFVQRRHLRWPDPGSILGLGRDVDVNASRLVDANYVRLPRKLAHPSESPAQVTSRGILPQPKTAVDDLGAVASRQGSVRLD